MKYARKKKKSPLLWILAVLAVAALAAVLALTLGNGGERSDPTAQTTEAPAETDFGLQDVPREPEGIELETPYITFYYPEEWEGRVEAEKVLSGSTCTLIFRTEMAGKTVELFRMILGREAAEGYLHGTLEDPAAGTINVYSSMNELNPADWSEKDFDTLCAMQERVNDLIGQLTEDQRFTR